MSLDPGARLLLYTDGLIERRDQPITDGLDRLLAALTYGPAYTVCAGVMAALLSGREPTDDTAILALRKDTG